MRDYYNYELIRDRRIVYIGVTNDPVRRQVEHRAEGKVFDYLRLVGNRKTYEGARRTEAEALERYRRNHGGFNPIFNATATG